MNCKEELNRGVLVFDSDYDPQNAFYFKVECPKWNGKYLHIRHKSDTDFTSPIEAPNYKSPITEDGTYVFLFDQNGKFWNTKVDNLFEYGQIHYTLVFASSVYQSKITRVLAAGEIRKKASLLEFNFQSGTFMVDWLVKKLNNQCTDELVKIVTQKLKQIHPMFEIVYNNEIFISKDTLSLETSFLDKLYRAGFEIRMYKNMSVCLTDIGELDKKLETMDQKSKEWEKLIIQRAQHIADYELYKPKQGGKTKRRKYKTKRTRKIR